MQSVNWSLIPNGEVFEALVTTLLSFEHPGTRVFGRGGRDGGQDARSADGLTVYQAKFHRTPSAAQAIRDAKREASKIEAYRTHSHPRASQWAGVSHWILATNAKFNPTDEQRWEDEIRPVFAKIGLSAEYWEAQYLEALLTRHPHVQRAFFEKETRTFLSLGEAQQVFQEGETFFVRPIDSEFLGRDSELQSFREFLAGAKRIALVAGPGGVGKTRFMLEAAEQSSGTWHVLWANVATMEANASWLATVPDMPTLIFLDEPEDVSTLRILVEQTRLRQTSPWKVIVSLRSLLSPLALYLQSFRVRETTATIQIDPLSSENAQRFASALLSSGPFSSRSTDWKSSIATKICRFASNYPIWIALVVAHLERHGDLGQLHRNTEVLSRQYVEAAIADAKLPAGQALELCRWISLLGSFRREDPTKTRLLCDKLGFGSGPELLAAINELSRSRLLTKRGAWDRIAEVKPDVIRDYILRSWLTVQIGDRQLEVSPSAATMIDDLIYSVKNNEFSATHRAILVALAHTERNFTSEGQSVGLVDRYENALLTALEGADVVGLKSIVDSMSVVAPAMPATVLGISGKVRTLALAPKEVPGLLGPITVTLNDSILALPRALYLAGRYSGDSRVRKAALRELLAIAEIEAKSSSSGGGQSACDLLRRTVRGEGSFWSEFEPEISAVGLELLEKIGRTDVTDTTIHVAKLILEPATSIERNQETVEGNKWILRHGAMVPGSPAWPTRKSLVEYIKKLLSDDDVTNERSRSCLWSILASSHGSLIRYNKDGQLVDLILSDLEWALPVLQARKGNLKELVDARKLWTWHVEFGSEGENTTAIAYELERIYAAHPLVKAFSDVDFDWRSDLESATAGYQERAAILSTQAASVIEKYVQRAIEFFGADGFGRFRQVAWYLGSQGGMVSEGTRDFVAQVLPEADGKMFAFALEVCAGWVWATRQSAPSTLEEVVGDVLDMCEDGGRRVSFLFRMYGEPTTHLVSVATAGEVEFLRGCIDDFEGVAKLPEFIACISWGLRHHWDKFCEVAGDAIDRFSTENADLSEIVSPLIWGISVSCMVDEATPDELPEWTVSQALRSPVALSNDRAWWNLKQILKRTHRPSLEWYLPKLIEFVGDVDRVSAYREPYGDEDSLAVLADAIEGQGLSVEGSEALDSLIALASSPGRFVLQRVLRDLDPDGLVVPNRIDAQVKAAGAIDAAGDFAYLTQAYSEGSSEWRAALWSFFDIAERASLAEQTRAYSLVSAGRITSWMTVPGEVPHVFVAKVEQYERLLADEVEPRFREYWKWRLARAQEELERQVELAKEEGYE